MATRLVLLGMAAATLSCGSSQGTDGSPVWVDGFNPPPVEAGYTRYVTDTVSLKPGDDLQWCKYVAPALDHDMDIVNIAGGQSPGGHHLIAYATANQAPVGTSRFCNSDDMLNVRILGGTGGEAQSNIAKWLPPGVIWRIPKGFAVMLNSHFIDATPNTLLGQGYMDIKLGPPQSTDQVASLYTTINDQFVLNPTPSIQTADTNCVAQQELEFFAVGNHMHALGYSAYSELIRADGTHQMLRSDPTWTNEQTFNPTITLFPAYNLLQVHVGETLHTHCEWVNTGGTVVTFPTEMCVGFAGFLPGDGNVLTCTDGQWGQ